jgi:SnoaL-like domain
VNVEEQVRQLLDKQEIEELLHHLCHLIDTFQIERIGPEIYAPEGSDDHGGGPVKGRDAIVAWYRDSTANIAAVAHNVSNIMVTVEGDSATARCNVVTWAWTMSGAPDNKTGNADYVLSLVYEDKLGRFEEGWRVEERVLVANTSKTGTAYLVAQGKLASTQKGIRSLSEREAPR